MAIIASKVRKYTSNLAIAIYNYGMSKWHDAIDPAIEAIDSAIGEDRARLNSAEAYLASHSDFNPAQHPLDALGLNGAISTLTNPRVRLPISNLARMRECGAEVIYGSESNTTHVDQLGLLRKNTYYSGTPTAASETSITDTGKSWAVNGLTDGRVIHLSDGGTNEAWRIVDANTATVARWSRPIGFTPTSYKISKLRIEKNGQLIESGSQNLFTNPEAFDNASWQKGGGVTVSANAAVAADGTTTADKLVSSTTATAFNTVYEAITPAAATDYTAAFDVEDAGYGYAYIQFRNFHSSGWKTAIFDLTNATVTSSDVDDAKIKHVRDNIYRISASLLTDQSVSSTAHVGVTDSPTTSSMTGDGVSGINVWGAKLQTGRLSTAYLDGTSVASKLSISTSDFPDPNDGITIGFDFTPLGNGADYDTLRLFGSNDTAGTGTEWRSVGSSSYSVGGLGGGGFFQNIDEADIVAGEKARWHFRYRNAGANLEWAVFKDGVEVGSGTATGNIAVPDDVFELGHYSYNATTGDGNYDNLIVADYMSNAQIRMD